MPALAEVPVHVSSVPIYVLKPEHAPAITEHLLALDEQDRYLRFGYSATNYQIESYVKSIRFGCDDVFGIFDSDLNLIAMAHLSYAVERDSTHGAEFGVSVSASARRRGYGQMLFERAVIHARNHGVTLMHVHALSENAPMLQIARKGGGTIVRDGSESEARLWLPPANFQTHVVEAIDEQLASADYQFKLYLKRIREMLGIQPQSAA